MNKDLSYVTAAWQSSCELKRETSCNMGYCPFYYTEKKTFHPTSCALCHWKKRIPVRVGTLWRGTVVVEVRRSDDKWFGTRLPNRTGPSLSDWSRHPGFSSNKHSLMFLPKEASGRNSTYSIFFWGNQITAQTERERRKERGREREPVTDHVWSDFICFVFFCNATDTKIFQTRINVARFSPPAQRV